MEVILRAFLLIAFTTAVQAEFIFDAQIRRDIGAAYQGDHQIRRLLVDKKKKKDRIHSHPDMHVESKGQSASKRKPKTIHDESGKRKVGSSSSKNVKGVSKATKGASSKMASDGSVGGGRKSGLDRLIVPTVAPTRRLASPTLGSHVPPSTSSPHLSTLEPTITPYEATEQPAVPFSANHAASRGAELDETTSSSFLSSTCQGIQTSLESCFATMSVVEARACKLCVVNSIPVNVTSCSEFEAESCSAIADECMACSDCRRVVGNFMTCAFQQALGCAISCDVQTHASQNAEHSRSTD
ncbi:hypothetical protein MPSEU_000648000 [Mayamaea pseudoterrestris]|nr:hypothetical protein MPSEU_000648000 [Mayamaea pseudoterrestris]